MSTGNNHKATESLATTGCELTMTAIGVLLGYSRIHDTDTRYAGPVQNQRQRLLLWYLVPMLVTVGCPYSCSVFGHVYSIIVAKCPRNGRDGPRIYAHVPAIS